MNKIQFLTELSSSLKSLPLDERAEILEDFEEHFAVGAQEGKTEEEIAASLGHPQQISKELLGAQQPQIEEVTVTATTYEPKEVTGTTTIYEPKETQVVSAPPSEKQVTDPPAYHHTKTEATSTSSNLFRSVLVALALGFFNLVIVLGPFITVVSLVFAGWVTGTAFIFTPILILLNALLYPTTFELFELFLSLTLTGLGFFLLIGMYHVTRFVGIGIARYVQFNVNLIRGV
ncbi:DUF1700 domain-containing protein [Bacillus tamaricis]|uniref:DUF1700 domain-containing protein n=1 Tax=Evansella tamaricis TaxID=2069301 RepID=A0ABS6J9N4_9BACI|nr:DUF1700 domain-containing protein [Evansella tamaricis]MBU9710223.1 DUF1700 domain-containing protein [Evansella tamaricis]